MARTRKLNAGYSTWVSDDCTSASEALAEAGRAAAYMEEDAKFIENATLHCYFPESGDPQYSVMLTVSQ